MSHALINFHVHEADGGDPEKTPAEKPGTPLKGTLFVCQAGEGSACAVPLPRHLYAAVYEMAQLAEDSAIEAAEEGSLSRLQELEERKAKLAGARAKRAEPSEDEEDPA